MPSLQKSKTFIKSLYRPTTAGGMQSGKKELSFSHQKSLDRGYLNKESKQTLPSQELRPKLIDYVGKPEEGIDVTKRMHERVDSK